jgi:hypothetical protein
MGVCSAIGSGVCASGATVGEGDVGLGLSIASGEGWFGIAVTDGIVPVFDGQLEPLQGEPESELEPQAARPSSAIDPRKLRWDMELPTSVPRPVVRRAQRAPSALGISARLQHCRSAPCRQLPRRSRGS